MHLREELDGVGAQPIASTGPDNVEAIRRRVRSALVASGLVLTAQKKLREMMRDSRPRALLEVRNSAAHGDPDLKMREITRTDIGDAFLRSLSS